MSMRWAPYLMGTVLIDTHCHVHVSCDPIAAGRTADTPQRCCSDDRETSTHDEPKDHNNINFSSSSSTSSNERKTGGVLVRNDLTRVGNADEERRKSTTVPLPDVVRITMGFAEEDWAAAFRYGYAAPCATSEAADHAVDNLSCARSIQTARTTPESSGMEDHHQPFRLEMSATGAGNSGGSPASPAPFFRFGLGLHPWSAHARSEGWLRDLTTLLEEHPRALLGEIGLDKVARTPDTRRVEWDDQLEVFQSQMGLAARLSRPVSVHCVKAYGKIVDYLKDAGESKTVKNRSRGHGGNPGGGKVCSGGGNGDNVAGIRRCRDGAASSGGDGGVLLESKAERSVGGERNLERDSGKTRRKNQQRLPPRIALHSFTGSVEVAKDIIRIGEGGGEGRGGQVYFGFSAAVNMRGDREARRLMDVLRVVPDSRILIETDRQAPEATGTTVAAEELLRVCGAIAEAKGVSVKEAAVLANKNAVRFLAHARSHEPLC